MLASWPPVLVASSILVIFTTIGVRWFLRHRSGYKLEHARTDLEKWATPCSLLFSALAIFLAWGIQQDNDRSTRQANIDAAAAAQQQRDLLQRAVSALHNTSDQLKANADASTKAAAILAAERQDQQRRIAMKPDVEVTALAVSQDGYSTPVAVVGHAGVVMKANQNPWKTVPGQKDYGLRIVVANKGRAIMPNGSLTVRCSALDGLGDPIVIPGGSTPAGNAIKARIALIETAAAQAKAEQESTGLKNLDAADAALDRTWEEALNILTMREAWIYRDWQSAIGDVMTRRLQAEERHFEVIGYGEFELFLASGTEAEKLAVERLLSIFDALASILFT